MSEERRNADTGEAALAPGDVVGYRNLGVADTVFSSADAAVAAGQRDESAALVGRVLCGRYKFLQVLGTGGMGAVYLARDHELDELIAVKMLHETVAASTEAVELLRHEVRLARRVTHRNVARIFELGEDAGRRFLTMEYVDGDSLASLLRREGRLPLRRAVQILVDVCRGLEAVHEAGIVHRDIKPDNVMVAHSGRVVLSDFGIARASRGGGASPLGASRAGTPAYMAPEQLLGHEVTVRSDLYSLAVMAFEMLVGELPWSALDPAHERTRAQPPDPRTRATEIPDAIARAIMRALSVQPEMRPASPLAFAEDIGSLFSQVGGGEPTSALTSAPAATRAPSKPSLAVLPFRNRGDAKDEYLASGFTEDLIDCLAGISELRVLSRGATARFAGDPREAHEIGRELAVDVVVEGSLQRTGDAVLVRARAIETGAGVQRWSQRCRVPAEDLLTTSDQVAEALAAALTQAASAAETNARPSALPNAGAMELYLKARESYRVFRPPAETVALFEEARELAPESPLVNAGYAMALLRLWMLQSLSDSHEFVTRFGTDVAERARAAAERANELAPSLGEAHMALALLALHQGDLVATMRELRITVSLAPSMAVAHAFLGDLLAEMARIPEAMRRVDTAALLDPTSSMPNYVRRRTAALLGDWQRAYALLANVPAIDTPLGWFLTARLAGYRRDRELLAHIHQQVSVMSSDPYGMKPSLLGQIEVYLDQRPGPEVYHLLRPSEQVAHTSKRGLANRFQTVAEVAGFSGDIDSGLDAVERAVELGLIDILWLDNCPLLQPLRREARFGALRARMQEHAYAAYDAFWA